MNRRIGVLGGSFDPLHYGHLILAEQIRQEVNLDLVVFVPAYVNPFKEGLPPAAGHHRVEMLKLALGDDPNFEINDIELQKEGPSYTFDTLTALQEEYGEDVDLFFIMGTDSFLELKDWHKAEELIRNFKFLIGLRRGYDEEKLHKAKKELREKYPLDARYIRIPELEISSTEIKRLIRDGRSVKFLMPESVIEYIDINDLYLDFAGRLREYARRNENPSRFAHTVGVVKAARELAERFGADPRKAEIAAWFHDACRAGGDLEHGKLAAAKLTELFGVEDEDILNAIKYHTTGRPGMSLLEKVIKIADMIEENRDYPGVEEMRRLARTEDIDRCLYKLMEHTKKYVKDRSRAYDPLSQEAMDWLREEMKSGGKDEE